MVEGGGAATFVYGRGGGGAATFVYGRGGGGDLRLW